MASEPPEEALHFRGKTLTPESPRPLHIAEPSNIPLLQNQMDATYHDTSSLESIPDVKEPTLNPALVGQGVQPADGQLANHAYSLLQGELGQMSSTGADITGSFPGSNTKTGGILSENESIFTSATSRDEVLTSSLSSSVPDPDPDPNPDLNPDTAPHLARIAATEEDNTTAQPVSNHLLRRPDALDVYQAAPGPSLASYDYQQPEACAQPATAGYSIATAAHNAGDINSDISQSSLLNAAVSYQSLLDSNVPSSYITSTSTAATTSSAVHPAAEPINQPTHNTLGDVPMSNLSVSYLSALPPRPPAHESETIQPSQEKGHDASSKEISQNDKSNSKPQSGYPPAVDPDIPAPPSNPETLQQTPLKSHSRKVSGSSRKRDSYDEYIEKNDPQDDTPWGPEIQKKYDDFLRDERVYVTEAHWDRFPAGSRLFIGNLPTERVTKRDLFHIFHMHGKLAQISIKQAYGFIQFLEPDSCRKALEAQQGATLRGRKIRDQTLKYQSRKEVLATLALRSLAGVTREGRGHQNTREIESHPVEVVRPLIDMTEARVGSRSVISEKRTNTDTVTELHRPLPREVPVETLITLGNAALTDMIVERDDGRGHVHPDPETHATVAPAQETKGMTVNLTCQSQEGTRVMSLKSSEFVYRVENAFRDRGLRCDVLILSPRIRPSAVVRRQVMEGVLAIVRISKVNQYSGKIPLQIFDRTGGMGNVRFNEYSELDLSLAAEVVVHARNSQKPNLMQLQPQLLPVALPPQPIQQPLPAQSEQAAIANLLSTLDSSTLHSLLNSLNQQQQLQAQQQQQTRQFQSQPLPTAAPPLNSTNLAALLGNLTRPSNANPPPIPTTTQSAQFAPPPNPIPHPNTNLASLLSKGPGNDAQFPQPQANMQVQQIMEQLMKWKQ
ncbi:nuclear polyadenylated RNA-binding protein 3 [Microsporum ferrugineum]